MKKILLILLTVAFLGTGCFASIQETQPDERALHYDGGPFTAEEFKNCIEPSAREIDNAFDEHYFYPSGQRTWRFTGGENSESGPVEVTDSTPITLDVPGTLTFTLNTQCDTLREFHERIGLKYKAYESDGWARMLEAYLGDPLEKALDQASQEYPWRQLLQDGELREDWEAEVSRLARIYVQDQAGGDYFCDPSFTGAEEAECGDFQLTLQKPIVPPSIQEALETTEAEKERENQARAQQTRSEVEAQTLQELVDVLGEETAVLFWAIREGINKGQIDVVPIPYGSDVIVNGSGNIAPPPAAPAPPDESDDE